MASRSIIPVRSRCSSLPRLAAAPRQAVFARAGRFYSTEGDAASTSASGEAAKGTEGGAGAAGGESAELVEAKKTAEALQEKIKEMQKDLLYHKADIQTLTRRVSDERAKASEFAISTFARSLLQTPDILNTALRHVPKPIEAGSPLEALYNGVELTQKAMYKTFSESGVVKMEVVQGSAFDPNLHEATFQIPKEIAPKRADGAEWGPGEVVEVAKEGWMIGSRVLRPAQVGVTQIE